MNGIVPLWKPRGLTSHDCVIRLRRLFSTKKVGHTGTLDPEVTGLLPICIGEATKIVPYLTDTNKTYKAEVTLGIATDTEDQTGTVIDQKNVEKRFDHETIKQVLSQFKGEIEQVTPLYSAVKVNGKKLYEYARDNQFVERPVRQVTIHSIHLDPNSINHKNNQASFIIETTVSKGTYIRTLAVDIGAKLGYPAHMSKLIRTATADFNEENAITLDQLNDLKQSDELKDALLPLESGLTHLPSYRVSQTLAQKVLYGQKLPRPENWQKNRPYRIEFNNQTLALYQVHPDKPDQIKPLRVFNTN